jgi:hypothetical protein
LTVSDALGKERCAISETGTGGACAPLSEILPAARVARFVRMTSDVGGADVPSNNYSI